MLEVLEIEHIIPLAQGGSNEETNLWLACSTCNAHKGTRVSGVDPETGETVALFNPRTAQWSEHFKWREDGLLIMGLTPIGRVTVLILDLNNERARNVRKRWVSAGWHPPRIHQKDNP
jgi:hypothetical protein